MDELSLRAPPSFSPRAAEVKAAAAAEAEAARVSHTEKLRASRDATVVVEEPRQVGQAPGRPAVGWEAAIAPENSSGGGVSGPWDLAACLALLCLNSSV